MTNPSGRHHDGSAGDANYGRIGGAYSAYRQPDPRLAARIEAALGDARTVLNVGAGAGSYEPTDRDVTAVEPSSSMRAQRPAHLPEAIDATAERLPFHDYSFDAAMTTFSIHQWSDLGAGLREMRRVTTGPIVVMTCDPELLDRLWLADYAPEVISTEARRYPSITAIRDVLGDIDVVNPPVPLDCSDGFNEAYYGRPEMLLDPAARSSCSAWSFVEEATVSSYIERLRADLDDGTWDVHTARCAVSRRSTDRSCSWSVRAAHPDPGASGTCPRFVSVSTPDIRPSSSVGRAAAPFVVIGGVLVIIGGFVSAAAAPAASYHSSWAVAYIVLVAGAAQVLLGLGQAVLAEETVPLAVRRAELWCWNIGNALVITGTLLDVPVVLYLGCVPLIVTLALVLWSIAHVRSTWVLWVMRVVVAVLLVSIPTGIVLQAVAH